MSRRDWNEISATNVRRFLSTHEDEIFYLLKNRDDQHILVWADAYDLNTGKTEFPLTKEQIETRFNVKL